MSASHALSPSMCPQCGYAFYVAHEAAGGSRAPSVGDFGVCSMCGEILQLDASLCVIRADPAKWAMLLDSKPDAAATLLLMQRWTQATAAARGPHSGQVKPPRPN